MELTKIHRVLRFKQSDWMKKYIDFNTKKGANGANSFGKDLLNCMGKQWKIYEKESMSG